MKNRETEELINIGKIGSSVGLRGEVRVTLYAQDSGNLKEGKVLLLKHAGKKPASDEEAGTELKCTGRGMEIYIHEDQLEELPEGEHYVRNLVGSRVIDLASGTEIGHLNDVIQNTAQSILDVETPEGKQVLIPAVDAFLRRIDEESGIIEVELIPGFLE